MLSSSRLSGPCERQISLEFPAESGVPSGRHICLDFLKPGVFVSFSFCFFGLVGPLTRPLGSWVVTRLPPGPCPSGLNLGFPSGHPHLFLPRPSGLNPVGFFSFLGCHVGQTCFPVYGHYQCARAWEWWHVSPRCCHRHY